MKHCKTCPYYRCQGHKCSSPKVFYGYGDTSNVMPDALVVEDDEGWGMIPGPEFGCIHHPDNEATDDLLRLAFAWRSAEIHESAINRGLRVGDPGAAEHAHHVALTALQIETDRLHKLEKE